MRIIDMFRVGFPPPQHLLPEDIIIIMNNERNQMTNWGKFYVGLISILNMFIIFINRKI